VADYDVLKADLHARFETVDTPPISLTEHHGLGVVTVDAHFERIAEVRPLVVRRLKR
jgi:predicted nucleic acid-binding protein